MSKEEQNDRSDRNIQVFVYNDREGKFEELTLELREDTSLYDLLESDHIFLFIDHNHSNAWTWIGSNTTTKMRFISAKIAPGVRDHCAFAYRLKTVDEGNESTAFKIMIGIESEIEQGEEVIGPMYPGDDPELSQELSLQKIIQLLEKVDIPEGYERIMVLVNKEIYRYKEIEKNYMGAMVKEKRLFPLKEKVPDGPYLAENYVPRILFSFNKVIIVELLEKKELDKIKFKNSKLS